MQNSGHKKVPSKTSGRPSYKTQAESHSHVGETAEELLHQIKKLVGELYQDSLHKIHKTQKNVSNQSDHLVQKAKDNPITSVLIVAGIGYLLSTFFRK